MGRLGLILVFALLNFGALGVGGILMGEGPSSEWYQQLDKAPWTPPGWVFGFAWFTIMICFSFYMADLFQKENSSLVLWLFGLQFVTNILWNYIFFNQHMVLLALVNLTILTSVVWLLFFKYRGIVGLQSYLVAPYMIWLLIAVSLNAYVWIKN